MASALETRNLSLSISGNPIFEDISLSLPKGAFAALCGRNGSGKSQLLRCIKGLVRQNAGEIYTDGIKTDPKTRMKKIAIVFQNAEMQIVVRVWRRMLLSDQRIWGLIKKKSEDGLPKHSE